MLYGDDDTLFFIDSVTELLQDFDPSLPYIITGMGLNRETLASPTVWQPGSRNKPFCDGSVVDGGFQRVILLSM